MCLYYKLCHFGRATREFIITVIISFLPVLVGAFIACIWSEDSFVDAFKTNFKSGEVFLYCSAFLVPYVHKKILSEKSSLCSILVFILSIYSFTVGAFIFSFVRLEEIMSRKMNVSADDILLIGCSIVFSTIIVWYYGVWSDHDKPKNIIDINRKNQNEFSAQLENRISRTVE